MGEWETPNTQSNPAPVSSTRTSLRVTWRIALATLKAVQTDLGSTDKSTNMNYHNLTAHINLYVGQEAPITNIQLKVGGKMADNNLVIVGANNLVILYQEATRDNPKYFS